MRHVLIVACIAFTFVIVSADVQARELSAACAAKKTEVEQRAKEAYQRWDTGLYDELKQELREIERFCTDEKLLEQIDVRYARQQKRVFALQQSLEKASQERKSEEWLDSQNAKLRDAKETLQNIGKERSELLAGMGKPSPVVEDIVESPAISLPEPQAVDSPAYNE